MDGLAYKNGWPIQARAASPAWFPSVRGDSAWRLPAGDRQRAVAEDRRSSHRYAPSPGAVALLRPVDVCPLCISGMNLGSIGMAVLRINPSRMGRIKDVSMTGMAFYYVDSRAYTGRPCRLDILLAEEGFYLEDIDFSVVTDRHRIDDDISDANPIGQLSVHFKHLSSHQIIRLKQFLAAYARQID